MTIAEELHRLRTLKGVSLRTVERETGVSNAYLSQLETGKTEKPSPHILHKLAEYYETEYKNLLRTAGYLEEKKGSARKVSDIHAALMSANLKDGQEEMIVKFIEYLSSQNSQ